MIPHPVPPDDWVAEGRRAASALEDVAAAIVSGREPEAAALVALAIARAHATQRRVGIADLVGGIALLTPPYDAPGLIECLRDGHPVSDIAFEVPDAPGVFALPSGHGAIAERWVFESARWERLIGGFREVDALLLLVAPPSAPGLATLIGRVDGVVAVDLPPTFVRAWPLLATVDRPEAELPPIVPGDPRQTPGGTPIVTRPRTGRRLLAAGALAALVLAAAWWVAPAGDPPPPAPVHAAAATPEPAIVLAPLGPVVNPADSARATAFSIELVAANTLSGANSRLEMRGVELPTPTLAPVLMGSTGRTWYRAMAGAWPERTDAEEFLRTLRARGVVPAELGRVLVTPYAILLVRGLAAVEVVDAVAAWEAQGVRAYGMVQADGSVRLYAGAFETTDQAVLLASALRDRGVEPQLAYRTGRMF